MNYMIEDRRGDWLWMEWDGEGYDPLGSGPLVYMTIGSVDLMEDVVKRALASCLQRDGVADSLGDGFRIAENGVVTYGHAGYLPNESYLQVCDESGETPYGEMVEKSLDVTWVEL